MAGSRKPGAQDAWIDSVEIEDGTLCRSASPRPGPIGITTEDVRDPETLTSLGRIETAGKISEELLYLSLIAIRRETGCEVGESLREQIPAFADILNAWRTSPAALRGGAGFPARRPIGGLRDALTALDLNFLPQSAGQGSDELICALTMGDAQRVVTGPDAGIDGDSVPITEELSRSIGILTRLILQGIVDYLLKDRSTTARPAGIGSSQASGNPNGGSGVTTLLAQLRSSKLGEAFAAWIAKNWTELLKNPRLRYWPQSAGGAASTRVVSQGRANVSPKPASTPAPEDPTFPGDLNMAAQASTLVAASAQGTPFCPM